MFKKILLASLLGSAAYAAPAVVINDQGCGMFDGDGGFAFTTSDHVVITSNGGGVLKCHAKGVANSTGSAVRHSFETTGAGCGTPAGYTTEWHETVSASGEAVLTCLVRP